MNKKSALDVKHLPTAGPLGGKKFLTSRQHQRAESSTLFIKIFQLFYEAAG